MLGQVNQSSLGRKSRRILVAQLALTTLAFVGTSACSDKESITYIESTPSREQTAGSGGAGGFGSAGSGAAAGTEGKDTNGNESVYVVYSTIDTPDTESSYYATTTSIDGDIPVEITAGLEFSGVRANLFSPPEGEYLLSASESTLTKFELNEKGELVKGETLSLANFGSTSIRIVVFVDESQAYVLDSEQRQVIRFNPSLMEVVGAVPVNDFECEEVETYFGFPVLRDNGLFFTRGCWDPTVTSTGSTLVQVDLETDEVTVTHDSRCMGMEVALLAENGDAYWFSDPQASVEWSISGMDGPRDCGLRVLAGESTFDPNWELDLTARTGSLSAIASVPTADSKIWVKVFEESAMTEPLPVPIDDVNWGWPVWRWALLDVTGDEPVVPDNNADLVAYYGDAILVDGRSFSPASNSTFTATTLMELTEDGFVERMTVSGELRGIVKLR